MGGVTRKGESSGPGYAGHIQGMCRRPLCPFLRFIKIYLMKRLTCHICRLSGVTGSEMNFHIVCGEASHGGECVENANSAAFVSGRGPS